jgi:hypothetical protein
MKEFNITDWVSKNRLKEQEEQEYPPYMYSEKGFGCHVCKFLNYNKDEGKYACASPDYQKYMGTYFLIDPDTREPISKENLSKYCSNWFLPK